MDLINNAGELTCCDSPPRCEGVEACTPAVTRRLDSYEDGNCDGEGYEGYEPGCRYGIGRCIRGILFKPLKCDGDLKPECLSTGTGQFEVEAVCVEEDDMKQKILVPKCTKGKPCESNLETKSVTINLGGAWGRAAYYPENDIDKAQCVNYIYKKWIFTNWKRANREGLKLCPP